MGEIEFIFQVKEYDTEALLPQVSKALQRRLELRNQQLRPGKAVPAEMTEEQRKQAKIKNIIVGVIWLIVGIFLLFSGMVKGDGGKWNVIIGAVAAFVGVKRLLPQRKLPNTEKFEKAAQEFLDEHKGVADGKERQVCFSDEEMIVVTGALEDLDQEAIPYEDVEFAMETEDIFLLVHGGRGVLLQKSDLTLGTVEEFRDYINAHVKSFTPYEPKAAEEGEQAAEVEEAQVELESEVIAEETAEQAEASEETEEE